MSVRLQSFLFTHHWLNTARDEGMWKWQKAAGLTNAVGKCPSVSAVAKQRALCEKVLQPLAAELFVRFSSCCLSPPVICSQHVRHLPSPRFSDAARDLLSRLTVWARLNPSSFPPSFPVRLVGSALPTPVPRLACESVPAAWASSCHTALLSLPANFLSCFALVFLQIFSLCLFPLLATPFVCSRCSRFLQWPLSFLPRILLGFHEVCCQSFPV